MDFLQKTGSGFTDAYDADTKEGRAGLFGASTVNNIINGIGGNQIDQMNAIRSSYKLSNLEKTGTPNLFSQGARVSEAGKIQQEADEARAYANQAYGQKTEQYSQAQNALQEWIKAMKAGNATYGR